MRGKGQGAKGMGQRKAERRRQKAEGRTQKNFSSLPFALAISPAGGGGAKRRGWTIFLAKAQRLAKWSDKFISARCPLRSALCVLPSAFCLPLPLAPCPLPFPSSLSKKIHVIQILPLQHIKIIKAYRNQRGHA